MDALEMMITGRRERVAEADVLEACAPLFTRLSDDEYVASIAPDAWTPIREAIRTLASDAVERATWVRALEPLSLDEYVVVRDELFVPGMPFAALPVESLHKQWSNERGNLFGGTRGLYLGDPAKHMSAVYAELDIVVPPAFTAMPDHLTLELELLALLLRAGNTNAANDVAAEHFDWLGTYVSALDERLWDVANAPNSSAERSHALTRGITFVRTLTLLVDRAVQHAGGHTRYW